MNIINKLELFKQVDVVLENSNNNNNKDDIDVIFRVDEKKFRLQAGTEMMTRNQEASLNLSSTFYNVGGRGEVLDVNAAMGLQSAFPLSVNFSKPIIGKDGKGIFGWVTSSLWSQYQHFIDGCSFKVKKLGLTIGMQTEWASGWRHDWNIGSELRQIYNVKESASFLIKREQGLDNWKHFS